MSDGLGDGTVTGPGRGERTSLGKTVGNRSLEGRKLGLLVESWFFVGSDVGFAVIICLLGLGVGFECFVGP